MFYLFLQHLILHKKEGQKVNQCVLNVNFCLFNVYAKKKKFFETVYNMWVRFNFLRNCGSYTLQKMFNKDDI